MHWHIDKCLYVNVQKKNENNMYNNINCVFEKNDFSMKKINDSTIKTNTNLCELSVPRKFSIL